MSQDVTQWLAEIQRLQQQLTSTQRELEQAYASANNWRRLYETEAQQRRTETESAQLQLSAYQQELQQLKGQFALAQDEQSVERSHLEQVVANLSEPELHQTLIALMLERDRVVQELNGEKQAHEQTRNNLTAALGDAIDLLGQQGYVNKRNEP